MRILNIKSLCVTINIALLAASAASVAPAATRGPDGAGYTATDATAFTFIEISGASGGSSVLSGVDDGTAPLTIPFAFRFYGQNYTSMCVSANGAIYFTDPGTCSSFNAGALGDFANTDLTGTATPGDFPSILPLWMDLGFTSSGSGAVYYQVLGTAPNRRFVVQWQMAQPAGSALPVTFEVILFEGSNTISFQYSQVSTGGGDPASNGGEATVGIRKTGGAANQIQWSYASAVLSNNYAIAFSSADPNGGGTPAPLGGGTGGFPPPALTVSWATPAAIVFGTPLGPNQLNATANASGTFVYSPAPGVLLPAGQQTITVTFTGTGGTVITQTVTLTVTQAPQTISFNALPAHLSSDAPFAVTAVSTSALPVLFKVLSGPATLTGGMLQVTGTGTVTIQALQPGNENYLAATPVTQSFNVTLGDAAITSLLNAASYGSGTLAAGEYAVLFGSSFADSTVAAAVLPLTTRLGGVSVSVTDSAGQNLPALLVYVSPTQVNFVMPDGLAAGTATVAVTNTAGKTANMAVTIAAINPALFTADASGKGAPAALVLTFAADNSVQVTPAFSCSGTPAVCTTAAIAVADPTQKVFLSLYGTGIRGQTDATHVSAMLGGVPVKVIFAGAQPTDPGLDQINLALDGSLAGTGVATLQITIDGVALNPVTINVQ